MFPDSSSDYSAFTTKVDVTHLAIFRFDLNLVVTKLGCIVQTGRFFLQVRNGLSIEWFVVVFFNTV